MKKFIIFSVLLLLGIVICSRSYKDCNNRAHYWAHANLAKNVLEWIKINENRYKERNGTYTKSLQELVLISESFEKEFSMIREDLKRQSAKYPG